MEQCSDAIRGLADCHQGASEQVRAAASFLKAVRVTSIFQINLCKACSINPDEHVKQHSKCWQQKAMLAGVTQCTSHIKTSTLN